MIQTDALVIGSGLAGLVMCLKVADRSKVLLCTKSTLSNTNSAMAQGGIAAVMSAEDSFEQHLIDTITAGADLGNRAVIEQIVRDAPARIEDLRRWGVVFDDDLTREGGHSARRILHVADHTGQAVHQAVLDRVREHPNITLMENCFALDLIVSDGRCVGASILDSARGVVFSVSSAAVFLATGGAGTLYLYTSNWSGATGDGIALAYRAGARVSNLEFMQFHPTCLHHPGARSFLISEALRGEGGELVDSSGHAFMLGYHPLGSLAPRDIVSRAIDSEMKRLGEPCMFLNMTMHPREFLARRFPVIFERCLSLGIDISVTPIPVVPAAHYMCGGVVTDLAGVTNIPGLYALGETACTGLHGANRLASNSLLECLVISHHASVHFLASGAVAAGLVSEPHYSKRALSLDELTAVSSMTDEIRRLMWNYVGIVRTNRRLERAARRLAILRREVEDYYSGYAPQADVEELRNLALVGALTVQCALSRAESRGIHFNLDYPERSVSARDSVFSVGAEIWGVCASANLTEVEAHYQTGFPSGESDHDDANKR